MHARGRSAIVLDLHAVQAEALERPDRAQREAGDAFLEAAQIGIGAHARARWIGRAAGRKPEDVNTGAGQRIGVVYDGVLGIGLAAQKWRRGWIDAHAARRIAKSGRRRTGARRWGQTAARPDERDQMERQDRSTQARWALPIGEDLSAASCGAFGALGGAAGCEWPGPCAAALVASSSAESALEPRRRRTVCPDAACFSR